MTYAVDYQLSGSRAAVEQAQPDRAAVWKDGRDDLRAEALAYTFEHGCWLDGSHPLGSRPMGL